MILRMCNKDEPVIGYTRSFSMRIEGSIEYCRLCVHLWRQVVTKYRLLSLGLAGASCLLIPSSVSGVANKEGLLHVE